MVLGHQLVLLVFVFLVVLQGALGDDLGIISRGVFMLCSQFLFFALDSFVPWVQVGLGSCPLVDRWYV